MQYCDRTAENFVQASESSEGEAVVATESDYLRMLE
jgi:hypothetical protein